MRKTKIVATIGPASSDVDILVQLIQKGMDVARLNFSHGSLESHFGIIENIRKAELIAGREIAIMMDTMGPEIRTGKFRKQKTILEAGREVIITPEIIRGDEKRFSVSYQGIAEDLLPGDHILIDDGLIDLEVNRIEKGEV